MTEVNLDDDNLLILRTGICSIGVCAPKAWDKERIEIETNSQSMTGISSSWQFDEEKDASKQCDDCEDRMHYVLIC